MIRVTVLFVLLSFTIASQEGVIFSTEESSRVQLSLPRNESVSSLVVWCSQPNTSLLLEPGGDYSPKIAIDITRANVWHFVYIYQPTLERPLSIWIPSNNIQYNLKNSTLQQLRVSSDSLVYWALCNYAYTCALLPPVTRESGEATLYLLAVLGVVCLLLLAALISLAVHSRRNLFHIYEKPTWPIVPPPLPPSIMHGTDDTQQKVRDNDKTSRSDDTSSVQTREQRKRLQQQLTGGDKHDSVNSLYGLILP